MEKWPIPAIGSIPYRLRGKGLGGGLTEFVACAVAADFIPSQNRPIHQIIDVPERSILRREFYSICFVAVYAYSPRMNSEAMPSYAIGRLGEWPSKATRKAQQTPAPGPRKRRILVVDDELSVRQALVLLMGHYGHVVESAASGEEALALFQPGKFDVVFTDFSMPTMKGDELARAIKTKAPAQPIVMLTAYSDTLQRFDPPISSIDLFLEKPFRLDIIRDAIVKLSPE